MTDRVPNQQPSVEPGPVRLAIVGEAPALEELSWCVCSQGHGFGLEHWANRVVVQRDRCVRCGSTSWEPRPTPFVGESGRLLDHLLEDSGLPRAQCFVGNCSQGPLGEGEKTLTHCEADLGLLQADLCAFRPTCVLVLGGLALQAFLGEGHSILNWRGSVFQGRGFKCVAARHPAAILREPSELALLRFDVRRAVMEAAFPDFHPPRRCIETPTDKQTLIARLWELREMGKPVGYDIEGGVDAGVTVCGFALSPAAALSIPFKRMDWSNVWSKTDEADIMAALRGVLEDPTVVKVMHNAAYECFVHRWLHSIQVQGVEDTMLGWHVLYPELLKDLSVVASVLTTQPYWGAPGAWGSDVERDTYNAIDACVTLEAWTALRCLFTPAHRAYYEHARDLLAPCLEMGFEGIAFDGAARDALLASIQQEVYALQGELDSLAGIAPPGFDEVRDTVAFARHREKCIAWADIVKYAKPTFAAKHEN